MSGCSRCGSERLAYVSGKVDDRFHMYLYAPDIEQNDYVNDTLGIGGGDYVKFTYCLHCGQIQGSFPRPYYFSDNMLEMEPGEYLGVASRSYCPECGTVDETQPDQCTICGFCWICDKPEALCDHKDQRCSTACDVTTGCECHGGYTE